MNTRIIEIRALDRKIAELQPDKNIIPKGKSGIGTIREAIGMTAMQLANRLGVTQPRISAMEKNEKNMKISTMEKVAAAMDWISFITSNLKHVFRILLKLMQGKKLKQYSKL